MYLTEEDHSGRDQTRSTTNALFITSPDIEVVAGTVSGFVFFWGGGGSNGRTLRIRRNRFVVVR